MLTLAHSGSHENLGSDKAPEDWRTPRRCASAQIPENRASVLDCGGPPPLFPSAFQTVPMLTETAIASPVRVSDAAGEDTRASFHRRRLEKLRLLPDFINGRCEAGSCEADERIVGGRESCRREPSERDAGGRFASG